MMGFRGCLSVGVVLAGGVAHAAPLVFGGETRALTTGVGGALASADLDSDGRVDIVAAAVEGSVSAWLAPGAAASTSPRVVTSMSPLDSTDAASAADFDGDGWTDLLVSGVRAESGCSAALLRGLGDGSFAPGVIVAVAAASFAGCSGLETGDFDGDGNLDFGLVYFYRPPDTSNGLNGAVDISLGRGAGAFDRLETHELSVADGLPYYSHATTSADVDADGVLDLVFASEVRWLSGPTAWRLQTLRGDGTGHFAFGPQRDFACQDCDLVSAAASDQNADGLPDVVVATHISFESDEYPFPILFFQNDGAGGFAEPDVVGTESGTLGVALADVQADGLDDIVVTNRLGRVSMLPALGPGRFGSPLAVLAGGSLAATLIADVDGDGTLDLAQVDGTAPGLRLAAGDGARSFGLPSLTRAPGFEPRVGSSVDVDGDGLLDVVVAAWERVDVLLGDGAGGLVVSASAPMAAPAWRVPATDLDGDGRVDLVLPSGTGFAMARGRPGPSFELPTASADAPWRDILASGWGDADGDGDGDLAVHELSGVIHLYLQDEQHGFALASELPAESTVRELVFADLNADGLTDLYVGDWGSGVDFEGQPNPGRSVVWLGEGCARFRQSAPIDARGVRHLLVDVDGDHALDLVTPGALHAGQGDGTFGAAQPLPSLEASDIAVADLDGDGRVDLAYGDGGGLWVARGNGAGSFGTPELIRQALNATSLVAADLSGNALPELLTVRSSYLDGAQVGDLVVLTNQTATCATE